MKHLYCAIEGKTLTYGDIRQSEYIAEIPVYFERDDKNGEPPCIHVLKKVASLQNFG